MTSSLMHDSFYLLANPETSFSLEKHGACLMVYFQNLQSPRSVFLALDSDIDSLVLLLIEMSGLLLT